MAIKDWKKNRGNYWKKSKLLSIHFINYDKFIRVEVWHELGWTSQSRIEVKDFKTKSQAIKFAKSYMRSH